MSDDTDEINVVRLRPRSGGPPVPPPPLPPEPRPLIPALPRGGPAEEQDGGEPAAGSWPALPTAAQMRPPLPMPELPALIHSADDSDEAEQDGGFALPAPEDPEAPTMRETLAMCMALVTAMGVAAAQGMWHRARHRQALADQARASADRSVGRAAAGARHVAGSHGGPGSKGSSLFRSPGAAHASRPLGGRFGPGGPGRPAGAGKPASGPHSGAHRGSRKGPGLFGGAGAPKSTRDKTGRGGKTTEARGKTGKGGGGWWPRRRADAGPGTAPKGTPGARVPKAGPGGRTTWVDRGTPRRMLKAGAEGLKRLTGGAEGGGKLRSKGPGRRRFRRLAERAGWVRRWRRRSRAASTPAAAETTSAEETTTPQGSPRRHGRGRGREAGGRSRWQRTDRPGDRRQDSPPPPPPPPPPRWEWMRPPPAGEEPVRVTVERVDQPGRRWEPEAAALPMPTTALPAPGSPDTSAVPSQTSMPQMPQPQEGDSAVPVVPGVPVRTNTQYADAELTIYDVIDADADMAEEITEGVADAVAAAEGCDQLMTRLEALHAKVVELRVPGVLEGLVVALMDKTNTVKAKAEAIAAGLPTASEAIAIAGANAAVRHQPLADAVRDAGHIRPAERDYHND
ncbi:hypothetical protein ABZU32_35710 [Sphaerisporangium sp. NPDC005288]|uniref:hypothetical protein n=1 Tax=Sphaerisporangium sp. NPDC005288 TaxID=3155114 RepID=UPI0033AADBE2